MPGIVSVTLPTISLRYAALNVKTVTILFSSLYYSSEYILSFLLPRCYQDRGNFSPINLWRKTSCQFLLSCPQFVVLIRDEQPDLR